MSTEALTGSMADTKNDFERFRFKYDSVDRYGISIDPNVRQRNESKVRKSLLAQSIRVASNLMPEVAAVRDRVQAQLDITPGIEMYVQPTGEHQAYCLAIGGGEAGQPVPAVILTSGLINILNSDEIAFVIGHELGHFIFGHHGYPDYRKSSNHVAQLNLLELNRSAEISADRIGLMGAASLEASIRAMIKVGTGLDERHLRFNVSSILDQVRELSELGGSEELAGSSHPMFPLRMKSLLWFQMSDVYREIGSHKDPIMSLEKIDERIHSDLSRLSGFAIESARRESFEVAKLWALMKLAASDNRLSKEEQSLIERHFGRRSAQKAIKLLRERGPDGLDEKFEGALQQVALHPLEAREQFVAELRRIGECWSKEDPIVNKVFDLISNRLFRH